MVQLDVRRTADSALAVHHDATLPDGTALNRVSSEDPPADPTPFSV
jgi:glycerophosphoryl diester phosphodiesterase